MNKLEQMATEFYHGSRAALGLRERIPSGNTLEVIVGQALYFLAMTEMGYTIPGLDVPGTTYVGRSNPWTAETFAHLMATAKPRAEVKKDDEEAAGGGWAR